MQISFRPLFPEGAADITGSMSDRVKYYVGKLSVMQNLLSIKRSEIFVMSHRKIGLRIL